MFIYPLDWELYGEIQFSLSTAILLSAFFSLGSHSLVNKYFPYFQSTQTKGFLGLLFIYSTINILLISFLLRSEEHTSELQSRPHLVCRLLLEKKNTLQQ